jgi:hypothetical protein
VNLLKDSKGAIDVELPISGSLDDPQFDIGGLIAQVIGGLLKKAVTSPFSLLMAAAGGAAEASADDLAFVDFGAGSSDLDAAGRKKLDTVAKALADRPAIRIELAARVDTEKDAQALKRAALRDKLEAARQEAAKAGGKGIDPAKPAPEEETKLLAQIAIGPEDLAALARRRSERVRSYLVESGHLAPGRILVASGDSVPAKPSTRVDLALR